MGRFYPFNYEQINIAAGLYNPSPVKSFNNATFAYWSRSLFHRIMSVIEFNGLPESWNQESTKDFLYYCLLMYGYVVVYEDPAFGFVFQPCTLEGYDFYYQPVTARVANPAYKGSNHRIIRLGDVPATTYVNKDTLPGELMCLTPDHFGVWDVIEHYAARLSAMDSGIDMSIVNNKFAFIIGARTKGIAAALKKVLDLVNKGEPAVVYDQRIGNDVNKDLEPFVQWDRKLKENYILTDQLQDKQTILNEFDAEIGIPSIPYQKKERMVEHEATSKTIDAVARCTTWLESLNGSLRNINARFGTDISAELRFKEAIFEEQTEEGEVDENGNS